MMKTQAEFEASVAWSRVVAACVIQNEEGKYLLVQEAQPKVYGLWNIPAGHVDKGESIEAAAVRETKEEAGFDVKLLKKIGIWHDAVEEAVRHAFTAEIVGGELTAQPGEILDAQWFSYNKIITMHNEGKLRVEWIFDAITRVQSDASDLG
jgi:8-oxo-dGTP pyrophosphatase MutT (NUDIX family)